MPLGIGKYLFLSPITDAVALAGFVLTGYASSGLNYFVSFLLNSNESLRVLVFSLYLITFAILTSIAATLTLNVKPEKWEA